jgi:hypothetical protein
VFGERWHFLAILSVGNAFSNLMNNSFNAM